MALDFITPAQRMAATLPKWQTEDFVDPLASLRRNQGPPARKSYPQPQTDRPARTPVFTKKIQLKPVGDGYPVYLEPDEDAEAGSDAAKHRFRSIKQVGDGVALLREAAEGAEIIEVKGIKAGDDTPLQVVDDGENAVVKGNDVEGIVHINVGGTIRSKDGIVMEINEGVRGKTGTLSFFGCDDTAASPLLSWEEGQVMTEGDITFNVGECQTSSPGA